MGDVGVERGNDSWETALSFHRTSIVDALKQVGVACLATRCADGRRGRRFHTETRSGCEGGRWGWVAGGQARIKKKEATLVGKMSGSFYVVLDMAAWCIEGRGRSAPHPPKSVTSITMLRSAGTFMAAH